MENPFDAAHEFEENYVAHADSVQRYLLWRTSDPNLAEDITSETFAKAWRSRAKFQGGSYKAWVYRIAQNLLIDHWRKHKELPMGEHVEQLVSSENLAEQAARDDEAFALKRAIAQLDERLRSVVTLRFVEGLSAREAAEVLNLQEGNVRVLQHRALKKLNSILSEQES